MPAPDIARGLNAATIFTGFGIGLVYKSLMSAFKLWKSTAGETLFRAARRRVDFS